jgi:hypothetical protein
MTSAVVLRLLCPRHKIIEGIVKRSASGRMCLLCSCTFVMRLSVRILAGDQLLRTDMSEAQREQLTALLQDIFEGFTHGIAHSLKEKTPQDVRC